MKLNPYVVGALGAGAGVALWELLLRPAPLDEVLACTTKEKAVGAQDLLAQVGIPSRVQHTWIDIYTILVKKADLAPAATVLGSRMWEFGKLVPVKAMRLDEM